MKSITKALILAGILGAATQPAMAATATGNMSVIAGILANCQVVTVGSLDFGTTITSLSSPLDTTADISVNCTNSTPYSVALDKGTYGTSTSARAMKNGTAVLNYEIYQDASRSVPWGDTTNTKSGTGTGSNQTITVYGRIPTQTLPAAGIYGDTVTVTIN